MFGVLGNQIKQFPFRWSNMLRHFSTTECKCFSANLTLAGTCRSWYNSTFLWLLPKNLAVINLCVTVYAVTLSFNSYLFYIIFWGIKWHFSGQRHNFSRLYPRNTLFSYPCFVICVAFFYIHGHCGRTCEQILEKIVWFFSTSNFLMNFTLFYSSVWHGLFLQNKYFSNLERDVFTKELLYQLTLQILSNNTTVLFVFLF